MNKTRLLQTGKWLFYILLIALNFFFYQINESPINLLVVILITINSLYEYYQIISKSNLKKVMIIALFVIYSFALISLLLIVDNFIVGSYGGVIKNFIILCINIAMIFFIIYKFKKRNP